MATYDSDDSPGKKKSKLKTLLVLIIVLGLLGGGAYAAWHFFLGDIYEEKFGGGSAAEDAVSQPARNAEPPATVTSGTTVPLPVFTVNLADPLGQRYIRLMLEVELANPKAAQDLERLKARIRDSIIMLLSSKTYADIATPESKIMLKSEITQRLNTILGPGKIYEVYITDMMIQ